MRQRLRNKPKRLFLRRTSKEALLGANPRQAQDEPYGKASFAFLRGSACDLEGVALELTVIDLKGAVSLRLFRIPFFVHKIERVFIFFGKKIIQAGFIFVLLHVPNYF
jgi:hypothetical protein